MVKLKSLGATRSARRPLGYAVTDKVRRRFLALATDRVVVFIVFAGISPLRRRLSWQNGSLGVIRQFRYA